MATPSRFALVLVVALLNSGTIMSQKCPLSARLTLKDTQSGFVGETGTMWTIEPDCTFTIARQMGAKVLEPHRRGQLTIDQQTRLKDILAESAHSDFPNAADRSPPVNPRRLVLSYEGKEAILTFPPGGGAIGSLSAANVDDRARPILGLASAIEDMLGR
jgi:hypothetical protein